MFFDSSILIPVVVGVIVLVLLVSAYVKVQTDKAFIISGLRKHPKVVTGRYIL